MFYHNSSSTVSVLSKRYAIGTVRRSVFHPCDHDVALAATVNAPSTTWPRRVRAACGI